MLEEKLCQIGFTQNEARIYLELLKMGPQAVSIVAKKSFINRTTVYSILKTLETKGLVSSYGNGNVMYFVASDPNILIGYMDRKCRTFDYQRRELLTLVPQFRKLINNYDFKKPIIRYFEGVEGVKYLMRDVVGRGNILYSYCPAHEWMQSRMKSFFIEYSKKLKELCKIKLILPKSLVTKELFGEIKIEESLYLAYDQFKEMFENHMNIYSEKITIIHVKNGEEYGIMIESKEFYKAQKIIFETLWEQYENKKNKVGNFI